MIEEVLAGASVLTPATQADPFLAADLDAGEASVIHLAKELNISAVLLDEKKARRVASLIYQFEVRGSAALLLEAKRRGLIERVAPALDAMLEGGYFIGPSLREECLKRAGE